MFFLDKTIFLFFKDYHTFDQVSKWVDDVRADNGDDTVIALVGNRIDLSNKRFLIRLSVCFYFIKFYDYLTNLKDK